MLTRTLWEQIGSHWPAAYWDDWIRHPDQRQGRACIRPEVVVGVVVKGRFRDHTRLARRERAMHSRCSGRE